MPRYELIRPVRQSRMARLWDAVRSYRIGAMSLKDPELVKYFGGGETSSGVSVSEFTAMNLASVWRAVCVVSNDVASLPMVLFRKDGKNTIQYEDHPLYRILHDDPNPEMSALTFRQTLQAHAMTWGNGYAEIERDNGGRPKYLWPITPDRVAPFRDGAVLRYRVKNENGREVILSLDDMLHIRGLGWDGTQGYAVLDKARESIALGLAAEKFGATFYGNGQTFGGVITHPTKFASPLARENFEKSLKNRSQGVSRAHGLLLMEEGMTYAQLGIPPDQAQFLESRQFQINEIARWFGVPPHKIGDLSRSAFANIDAENISYVQQTIVHWAVTWEQETRRKLISPLERRQQFVKIIVEGLLRGDSQGRAALEAAEFNIGALTPNEARAYSERNPIAGGDRGFVQGGMIALDRYDEYMDAQIASLTAKANPPASDDARVQVLEAELRGERALVEQIRKEVEEAKEQKRETFDALDVANAGLVEARDHIDTERRGRVEAETVVETLTERTGVLASQLSDAQARLETASQEVEALKATVGQTLAECEAVKALLAAAETARDEAKRAVDGLTADLDTVAAHLTEVEKDLSVALEKGVKASGECARMSVERQAAEQAQQAAEVAMAEAVSARDAAIASLTAADIARQLAETDAKTLKDAAAKRDAAVVAAHRALVVEALQRVVTKEADRARRHQATAAKLRAWMETFYADHSETVAAALRPALVAILAWRQSDVDVDAVAAGLAAEHCDESQRQLRSVIAVEDYPVQLERMLQRWDERRPVALADAVLREDLGYVQRGQ